MRAHYAGRRRLTASVSCAGRSNCLLGLRPACLGDTAEEQEQHSAHCLFVLVFEVPAKETHRDVDPKRRKRLHRIKKV